MFINPENVNIIHLSNLVQKTYKHILLLYNLCTTLEESFHETNRLISILRFQQIINTLNTFHCHCIYFLNLFMSARNSMLQM